MPLFDRLFGKKEKEKKPIKHTPERREPLQSSRFKKGDKIQNRYEVKAVLGGGMGVVYIALDDEWDQLFAIKTFQDKFIWNEDIINRFMEEAETWVNLERHTNTVFANSVQKIEGKPFIFLEYIDGGDLSQFIGRMDISQALDFAIQFCTGMDYAYNKLGVIHRDIKPGNVMVARNDRFRFGYAFKVTDFGLVKALGKAYVEGLLESPSVSTGMGTWPYMPPEQFSEEIQAKFSFKPKPITTRTDIYSFGVTFYEMTTGRLPFSDVSEIFTKSPINPRSINSQIPERLDGLIMKCLEKNPADRYRDFDGLREELMDRYTHLTGEKYDVKGKKEPLNEYDWNNKAIALSILGRYEKALECCDKAVKIKPRFAAVWNSKGATLSYLCRYKEAIECCDKALEIDSGYANAWGSKGIAFAELGRHKEAIECYSKSLEINPRDDMVWNGKGNALASLGKYEKAIGCFDKSLRINQRLDKAWHAKGNALDALGEYEKAMECFDKALKINPRNEKTWNDKGCTLNNLGECEKAIERFDKALKINPKYAYAWNNKGSALIHLGEYEKAMECFDKALKINPKYAYAWNNKGNVLTLLERYEDAIRCYEKALVINPSYENARKNRKIASNRLHGT